MGAFPRVAHWDDDDFFDILMGTSDGSVRYYRNLGDGSFDEGIPLEVGPPGAKVPIDVGSRSAVCIVDWNEDGRRDLLLGAYDAKFHLFLNTGSDLAPEFETSSPLSGPGGDLSVPDSRSSPDMLDLDGDGAKDLIAGDNEGRLWFFPNLGTNSAPEFDGSWRIESASVPYDVENFGRSRPRICDFNGDGLPDILTGSVLGTVHLLPGGEYIPDEVPEVGAARARLSAWPNPFNPRTKLSLAVPEGGAELRLEIFDSSGRRMRVLAAGRMDEGRREFIWNGRDDAGHRLPSGLYLARASMPDRRLLKKLVMLK